MMAKCVAPCWWQCWQCTGNVPGTWPQVTRQARAGHWLQASTLDTSHALTRHIATNENSNHDGTNRGTLALMNGFIAISSGFLVPFRICIKHGRDMRRDVRHEANKAIELTESVA